MKLKHGSFHIGSKFLLVLRLYMETLNKFDAVCLENNLAIRFEMFCCFD